MNDYLDIESTNIKEDREMFIKTFDSYIMKNKNLQRKHFTRM